MTSSNLNINCTASLYNAAKEHGYLWLIKLIGSFQEQLVFSKDYFQVWEVSKGSKAIGVACYDGYENLITSISVEGKLHTDNLTVWLVGGVLMYPEDY